MMDTLMCSRSNTGNVSAFTSSITIMKGSVMRKISLLGILLLASSLAFALPRPVKVIGAGLGAAAKAPYNLSSGTSLTLSRDTVYILTGFYYVDSLAVLTIQAGTVIMGDSATNGTLIVRRGGKILASGSKTEPIVFTSSKPAGKRKRGDWGGIVILGNAPTNKPVTTKIEGIDLGGEYGGADPNDNSGILRYVRIEYPGIVISLNNEINGLTLGGVGSGTTIEYVQVTNSGDDSFEWFGGTVNAKYLIALNGTDDDFDTDFGFSGRIQFAFAKRDANLWDAAGQSNGFESDNDGTPTTAAPLTSPVFSNVTLIGPQTDTSVALPAGHKFEYAALIRRNTRLSIHNSVMIGYPFGLSLRNDSTAAYALQENLQLRNISLQARTNVLHTSTVAGAVGFSFPAFYGTAGWNNTGSSPRQPSALSLVDPFNTAAPDARPSVSSEAATAGAGFTGTQTANAFFTPVSYRGAFDPGKSRDQQWDNGWVNYAPQNTDYSSGTTTVRTVDHSVPEGFALEQNFPNPFNPSTSIRYSVPVQSRVVLQIFNSLGQESAVAVNAEQAAGTYSVSFDASALSSGIYFYRLTAGSYSVTKRMQLIR